MVSVRLIAVGAVAVCAAGAFGDIPLAVENPGFEAVDGGKARGWSYGANFTASRDGQNGNGGLVWRYAKAIDDVDSIERCAWQDLGPLRAGRRYTVSLEVKPTGVTTEKPSKKQGITMCLEGFSAEGRRIFRDAPHMLTYANGTGDWQKLVLLTEPIPRGIVRSRLAIFAAKCTGGSAAIDNAMVCEVERLPVEAVHSGAYRDEATDGEVRFAASLNYEDGTKPTDYEAEFRYKGIDGGVKCVRASEMTPYGAKVTLNVSDFAFGTNTVGCEMRKDGVVLGRNGMKFVRREKPVQRRVWVDRYGRTIIDGKPTFLMGMYWESPITITDERLKLYAEGEFNVLCAEFKSREELDLVAKYGFYAAVNVAGGYEDADHGLARSRKVIEMAKDHPATVLMYIDDEQPVANAKWIRARKELVWELDPDHPTWIADYRAQDARDQMDGFDILGCDQYPVGCMGGEGNLQDTYRIMRKVREMTQRNFGLRAAIHIPQYFGWAWLRSRVNCRQNRSPTPADMANMSWQYIAVGGNGLVGYSFKHMNLRNRDRERPYERAELFWPAFKAVVHDIRRYEDVILSVEPAPRIVRGETDKIAARVWRKGGDVYLLVVNGENKMAHAEIELSETAGKVVDWDFCDKPEVDGKVVKFDFYPNAFCMVRLGKDK